MTMPPGISDVKQLRLPSGPLGACYPGVYLEIKKQNIQIYGLLGYIIQRVACSCV